MPVIAIAPFFGPSGALVSPSSTELTYPPDYEADLVSRGVARYARPPSIPRQEIPVTATPSDQGPTFQGVELAASPLRLVGARKLRGFLGALAKASFQRVHLPLHSHSIGAGANATGAGSYGATEQAAYRTQSWAAILAKALSAHFGGIGSSCGEPMAGAGAAAGNPLFTAGGGAPALGQTWGAGPAGWRMALTAPAHTYSFTAVGATIKVYAVAGAGGTALRWSAPSVAAGATQTCTGASAVATPSGTSYWYETTISGVTPGETVTLMGPTSSSVVPYFIDLDHRTDAGVSVHRMCASGQPGVAIHASMMDGTDTQGPTATWIGAGAIPSNIRLGQAQSMSTRMGSIPGVILHCDVNDLNTWDVTTGSAWGYTIADHKRHLSNYLAYHESLGIPVIVVLGPIRDPAFLPGTRPFGQAELLSAYREVIDAAPHAGYIDWTAEYMASGVLATGYALQTADSLLYDVVHPGPAGHPYWGIGTARAIINAYNAK